MISCPNCQKPMRPEVYFVYRIFLCDHCGYSYCVETHEWLDENGNRIEDKIIEPIL